MSKSSSIGEISGNSDGYSMVYATINVLINLFSRISENTWLGNLNVVPSILEEIRRAML